MGLQAVRHVTDDITWGIGRLGLSAGLCTECHVVNRVLPESTADDTGIPTNSEGGRIDWSMGRYAAKALSVLNPISLLVGKIVGITVGEKVEEVLFEWFSPKCAPRRRPSRKYGRDGWSADFKRNKKTERLYAAKDKELTASECITFSAPLNSGKLSHCMWDVVFEQLLRP